MNIAGIGFLVRGLPGPAMALVEKRYGEFSGTRAWIECEVDWGARYDNPGLGRVLFEETAGGWRIDRGDFGAEWDPAAARCGVETADSEYAFDSFLRVWLSALLISEGGGLFHGAGLSRSGRGFLFIGPSGAGKSTLARYFAAGELLSDELTAVRGEAGGFRVFGTPFMGELNYGGSNISSPLEKVYILNRESPAGKRMVSRAVAVAELWGTLMCLSRSAFFLKRAMTLCENMAAGGCEEFSYDLAEGPGALLNGD